MNVAVIGAGYVGLVQSAGLTHLGHTVTLGEANADRVADLRAGRIPIFEPGLAELIERAIENDLLFFESDNHAAVRGADVIFLTLPTPPGADGHADLRIVKSVAAELAEVLTPDQLLVTKSTVPVGTAESLRSILREKGCEAGVLSNPEFLAEGTAVDDFMRSDRIVIGAFEQDHGDRVAALYTGLEGEILITDPVSAELVKYASNAYLATRLTFANAISNISEEVGADAVQVLEAMGLDSRIGPKFLRPGPGYGGSCFPKDTAALLGITAGVGYDFPLLEAVIATDHYQRSRIIEKAGAMLGGAAGKRIAVWGVAFKANTDDVRESPAVRIARGLADAGAAIVMTDPEARTDEFPVVDDPVLAAENADMVIIATEWPEFIHADFAKVAEVMAGDIVYDVRNLLDPEAVRAAGLTYIAIGRPTI